MTIFLHIGLNKTGTSSIQRFCDRHREKLRDYGLEYPQPGIHDSAHYGLSKALMGQPAADVVRSPDGIEDTVRAALAARRQVVLSSEYFFLAKDGEVAKVRDFLARFDTQCKVIVYLRRHDEWIASLFNQALKTAPKHNPWHSDIRDYTLHLLGSSEIEVRYSVVLDRWARHFGIEAMVVRPFEAAQFRMGELVWDFLGTIDAALPIRLQNEGIAPERVNESVPEHLLRAVEYIKSTELNPETKRTVTSLLLKASSTAIAVKNPRRHWDGRMFSLAPYLRRAVVNMFAEDYRYVAQKYLGAEDGILFRDRAV